MWQCGVLNTAASNFSSHEVLIHVEVFCMRVRVNFTSRAEIMPRGQVVLLRARWNLYIGVNEIIANNANESSRTYHNLNTTNF